MFIFLLQYTYSAEPQEQQVQYQRPRYQQQPQYNQQPQYSSAADVSSFSYSSPVVSYSNLGLLRQLAGKSTTPSHGTPVSYTPSQSSAKPQYQQPQGKVQYVPESNYQGSQNAYASPSTYSDTSSSFSPTDYSAYSSAQSQSQPQAQSPATYQTRSAYPTVASQPRAQSPSVYSQPQKSYEDASDTYQQLSQKSLFSTSNQPQALTYQSGIAGRKYTYVQSPAQQTYQSANGPQVQYVQPAAQQYSPQAASSSAYETAASPEYSYSQQSPQAQYYSAAPQSKYSKPGITYA